MLFSYQWLQSFFKKRLPSPKKLADLLTLHFAEVEEVKKIGRDFGLEIDIRPNRAPDCFSHLGIAREIGAIIKSKVKIPAFASAFVKTTADKKASAGKQNLKTNDFISVQLKDREGCRRYTARVISDVRVAPSPKWLQEKLRVCGLRPINNIVDATNYAMLETGQPLHAFDYEKIKNRKIQKSGAKIKNSSKVIIIRKAKKGERIITLDNEKYDLDEDILIIADEEGPLAIAGIKGGKKAEIGAETKIVVLEGANFDSRVIRRASRKINLRTDASLRFEHGIDPNLTESALNRAAELIGKISGGKIVSGISDVYPRRVLPKKILLDLNHLKKLLGLEIPKKEAIRILNNLGFGAKEKKQNLLEVSVPTSRLDVSLPEDLIEEVGRIYGYEKIPAIFPLASLVPPEKNLDIFWKNLIKNILKEAGFNEIYNYSFIGEKEAELFGESKEDLVELENPLSSEQRYLRPSLLPNLLKNAKNNIKQFNEIKIFELGKIFSKRQMKEKKMLAGLMLGDAFYELKGVIDLLLNKLGIGNIWYDEYQPTPEDSKKEIWHPKKCAEIKVGNEEIGFLGEISSRIAGFFKIGRQVVLFDIDFEKLSRLASEEHEYRPLSRYPSAVRDLALLVPRQVRVEEVLNKIEQAGGVLVRDIDLFDIYEGEELPEGKKNLAFHIIYQSEQKTLSSKEINELQNKIIGALEENPEWQVRK